MAAITPDVTPRIEIKLHDLGACELASVSDSGVQFEFTARDDSLGLRRVLEKVV